MDLARAALDDQKEALAYGVKMPIVYTSVLVNDWTSFAELGIRSASAPGMYHTGVNLGRVVQLGSYRPPRTPQEPIVLHMTRTPCAPGRPKKEQHRLGRQDPVRRRIRGHRRHCRLRHRRLRESAPR